MKTCPVCGKIYQGDLNFCFDDGALLDDSAVAGTEKTLPYAAPFMPAMHDRQRPANESINRRRTAESNFQAVAKSDWRGLGTLLIVSAAFVAVGIFGYFAFNRLNAASDRTDEPANRSALTIEKRERPTGAAGTKKARQKVEIGERVQDKFGRTYIKCLLTNIGETVIEQPSVRLTLYKNDLKLNDLSGESDLKFLPPKQTIPVWISISEEESHYTSARLDESIEPQAAEKEFAALFPTLIYSDAKMQTENKIALINFKEFPENYYTVSGIVENRQLEKIEPLIYVLFRDRTGEIVAVGETRPPILRRNEKVKFTVTTSIAGLFGTPLTFEIIAVNE